MFFFLPSVKRIMCALLQVQAQSQLVFLPGVSACGMIVFTAVKSNEIWNTLIMLSSDCLAYIMSVSDCSEDKQHFISDYDS